MKMISTFPLLGVLNMKGYRANALCLIAIFLLPAMAMAQSPATKALGENSNEKWKDGEIGYTIGCSLAASLGIAACGELPSGKQTQQNQNSSDSSAAISATQKLQADPGDVLTLSPQALQNTHTQDYQNSADTSAEDTTIGAAFKQVQEAQDYVAASTPNSDIIMKSQFLQNRHELDAESKTDGEVAKEVLLDQLSGIAQPDVERPGLGAFDAMSDALEATKAFFEASTSSYTAGPTLDQGPAFTPEETQNIEDQMNQYGQAQQQYQQALQQLNDLMQQQAANNPNWKNLPSPAQVQQLNGPQIVNGWQNQIVIPDCVLHHYACNK